MNKKKCIISDIMKWKIGDVQIENQVVLAPMAGVTDSPFRTIIKSMGCGLVESEMISSKALVNGHHKNKEILHTTDYERPISQQIFGPDALTLKRAARYVYENMHPDIIDINMGCPVKKVALRANSGSALLKYPDKIYKIIKSLRDTLPIPITVKIRSGWDCNTINALEIAKVVESARASAITIHPRTRTQGYDIHSNWDIIKEIKENISIPVIGNGDIMTCYDAKDMLNQTNCDAVMIARGVLGYPWLIRECVDYIDNNKNPHKITAKEKVDMFEKHATLIEEHYSPKDALSKLRMHAAYYIKNMPHAKKVKQEIFKTDSKNELVELLHDFID